MNKFLKTLASLFTELHDSQGVGTVMIIDEINKEYENHMNKKELPSFLYEDKGRIRVGVHGDTDVTDRWNNYIGL